MKLTIQDSREIKSVPHGPPQEQLHIVTKADRDVVFIPTVIVVLDTGVEAIMMLHKDVSFAPKTRLFVAGLRSTVGYKHQLSS